MGKFTRETIVVYSDSENTCDSLQLIDPVTNLSLEHSEKKKSPAQEDFDDQSNKLEKLHLNDSNEKIQKRIKTRNESRHRPYILPNKSKPKIENNKKDQYQMGFLKSLGYIEYSSTKKSTKVEGANDVDTIRQLFNQVNQSIKSTFSKYLKFNDQSKQNLYICNKRLH